MKDFPGTGSSGPCSTVAGAGAGSSGPGSIVAGADTRVLPVDTQRTIAAGAWWSGRGATPNYATVSQILADLDHQLAETAAAARMAFAPIDVVGAESWPLTRHDVACVYSEVRIAIAPGRPRRSLRAFFQWAHVRFGWSSRRAPADIVLAGEGVR